VHATVLHSMRRTTATWHPSAVRPRWKASAQCQQRPTRRTSTAAEADTPTAPTTPRTTSAIHVRSKVPKPCHARLQHQPVPSPVPCHLREGATPHQQYKRTNPAVAVGPGVARATGDPYTPPTRTARWPYGTTPHGTTRGTALSRSPQRQLGSPVVREADVAEDLEHDPH